MTARTLDRYALSALLPLATLMTLAGTDLAAQTTHVVQGDSFAFQNAVQAASPGDVLVVRAGSYFGGAVHKGLTVRCDPGVSFVQNGRSTSLSVFIPAGQLFRMRGGAIGNFGALFPSLATGGRGVLVFENVGVGPNAQLSGTQVSFHRCGFANTIVRPYTEPARVSFADCTVRGQLQIDSAEVTVAGGSVTGPDAVFFFSDPAVEATSSRVTITGDAGTVIQTGTGVTATTPAILANGGSLVVGPRVQLVSPAPQPIGGSGPVTVRDLPTIEAAPAGPGETFTVDVDAEPGSSTHVLLGLPEPTRSTPFGTLWVGLGSLVLDSGIVPPNGTRSTSLTLPATLPADLPLVLQTITTLTDGQLWVGPPTVVLLD